MNPHNNYVTYCIYYNRSFPTLNQFPSIKARFLDRFRRSLDRLAIDNSSTGILISTPFFSDLLTNLSIDLL